MKEDCMSMNPECKEVDCKGCEKFRSRKAFRDKFNKGKDKEKDVRGTELLS